MAAMEIEGRTKISLGHPKLIVQNRLIASFGQVEMITPQVTTKGMQPGSLA
jgi:hypothetical protein